MKLSLVIPVYNERATLQEKKIGKDGVRAVHCIVKYESRRRA